MGVITLERETLINILFEIFCISSQHQRSFNQRVGGYRAELEFTHLDFGNQIHVLSGGWVLYRQILAPNYNNQAIYITISLDDKINYVEFYEIIQNLPEIINCYYCEIKLEDWENYEINNINFYYPNFQFFRYESGAFIEAELEEILGFFTDKNSRNFRINDKEISRLDYIHQFPEDAIIDLYCNRFFIDIILKTKKKEIFDFDSLWYENERYSLVEIKEKFPENFENADLNVWFYGWDTRRYAWYLYITMMLNIDCKYVIREVDNTEVPNFRTWKYISIHDFNRSVGWSASLLGGAGMAGGRSSTLIAPYLAFNDLL